MFRIPLALATLAISTAAVAAPAMSGATFIRKAGASDQYEIQSSRLVMNSRNGQVRDFARDMVRDHSKSTADVKAAARRAGLRVGPPVLEPMQARMIAQLRRTPASRRDAVYLDQQKQAHRMALDLHQSYADHGQVAPLRRTAANIAPVVQHHIDMLDRM